MNIGAKTQAVIWDFDGTLFDSFDVYSAVLAEALVLHQLPIPEREVLLLHFHGSLEDSIAAAISLADDELLDKIVADFLVAQDNYYHSPERYFFRDALDLAVALQAAKIPQFIITNRCHAGRGNASPRQLIADSVLCGAIVDYVCGDESEYRKPDARVALPMLAKYGIQPEAAIVIGDQHVDAELARNLGAQAIIVTRTDQASQLEALPDWQSFATLVASLKTVKLS